MTWRPPEGTLRPIRLTSGLWVVTGGDFTDNGSNGNGARSENSSGSINIPLLGGKAISLTNPDPDDAAALFAMAPVLDAYGQQITGDTVWSVYAEIDFPELVPTISDDVYVGMALVNEASITGGTVDGQILGFEANATNPRVRGNSLINGTSGNAANGAATAGVAGAAVGWRRTRTGAGNLGNILAAPIAGIDTSGVPVSGGGSAAGTTITTIGTGAWYWALWVGRTDAADVTAYTVKPRWRYSATSQST